MSPQVTENKIVTPKDERSAKEAITDAVGDMRETARGLYERTKSRAAEFEGDFEDYVRDNPIRSLAIGLSRT